MLNYTVLASVVATESSNYYLVLSFAIAGSGSRAAMAVLETGFTENMTVWVSKYICIQYTLILT